MSEHHVIDRWLLRDTIQADKQAYIEARHSTAQHSTAQHSTAQHSTAQHSTAQPGAQHSAAGCTAQHSASDPDRHASRAYRQRRPGPLLLKIRSLPPSPALHHLSAPPLLPAVPALVPLQFAYAAYTATDTRPRQNSTTCVVNQEIW